MKNLLLFACSVFSFICHAQDGVLDATFGTGGKSYSGFISDLGSPLPVAIQSDGKFLQATSAPVGGVYQTVVLRYNSNGGLDASFGMSGIFTSGFPSHNAATDLAIQPDGKIVVGGLIDSAGTNCFMVMRINSNGTIDATFGNNGRKIIGFNSQESNGTSLALQSDGKILIAGITSDSTGDLYQFGVARLTTTGDLDTSFDTDGRLTTAVGASFDIIDDMIIQADGKILVAGVSYGANAQVAVVRYTTAGALDNTFASGGKFVWSNNNLDAQAHSLAMQPDGKIIVSGSIDNGSNYDYLIMRLTSAGALDNTFNTNGRVITAIGTDDDEAYSVAIQADGKIVAGGDIYVPAQQGFDVAVLRYTAAGTLDNSFGTSGKTIVDMNSGSDDNYGMIASQGTKILVGVLHYDVSDNKVPSAFRLSNSSAFFNPLACGTPPAAPTISITGSILTSSSSGNNQWYLNGIAIPGATGQNYSATTSGLYTVTITSGGCISGASNTITYNITGISSPVLDIKITMAPNPVANKMTITYKGNDKLTVEVIDLSGRNVLSRQSFTTKRELDFTGYANGTYLVRIMNEKTNERVQKLVVKQ